MQEKEGWRQATAPGKPGSVGFGMYLLGIDGTKAGMLEK